MYVIKIFSVSECGCDLLGFNALLVLVVLILLLISHDAIFFSD